jgi:hypothetical protein
MLVSRRTSRRRKLKSARPDKNCRRSGWKIVTVYRDNCISGYKGRKERPTLLITLLNDSNDARHHKRGVSVFQA